jgi:hypothetical protein
VVIDYTDAFGIKQTLIFDFGKRLREAQQMIYNRMVTCRSKKLQQLELHKNKIFSNKGHTLAEDAKAINDNHKYAHPHTIEKAKPENKATDQTGKIPIDYPAAMDTNKPAEINGADDDPIRILKVRFAKGEISKEEYEEMRKTLESN